uniref:Uncharacterized protein n=1 Tax=Manihot esculenta TaxID=3983 RepID=A0A2C9V3R2_MANES
MKIVSLSRRYLHLWSFLLLFNFTCILTVFCEVDLQISDCLLLLGVCFLLLSMADESLRKRFDETLYMHDIYNLIQFGE